MMNDKRSSSPSRSRERHIIIPDPVRAYLEAKHYFTCSLLWWFGRSGRSVGAPLSSPSCIIFPGNKIFQQHSQEEKMMHDAQKILFKRSTFSYEYRNHDSPDEDHSCSSRESHELLVSWLSGRVHTVRIPFFIFMTITMIFDIIAISGGTLGFWIPHHLFSSTSERSDQLSKWMLAPTIGSSFFFVWFSLPDPISIFHPKIQSRII